MSTVDAVVEPATPSATARLASAVRGAGILIPFLILFVALSFASESFLRFQNLANILDQQAGIIIVACAGTLVLIAGGIDLSIGAIYGLAAATSLNVASAIGTPAGVTEPEPVAEPSCGRLP